MNSYLGNLIREQWAETHLDNEADLCARLNALNALLDDMIPILVPHTAHDHPLQLSSQGALVCHRQHLHRQVDICWCAVCKAKDEAAVNGSSRGACHWQHLQHQMGFPGAQHTERA